MTAPEKDIIIFSIGPVQGFISASRRTQDLAAASFLLSGLVKDVLDKARALDAEVIFPLLSPGASGLPNRLALIAENEKGEGLASKLEKHAREQWKNQVGNPVKQLLVKNGIHIWGPTADNQMEDFLEVYWVVKDWNGQDSTYATDYRTASLGFDARKNLRQYPTQIQPGLKCSLCGIRSALGSKSDWTKISTAFGARQVRDNEHLCAVCTAKRLGDRANVSYLAPLGRFPSTSDVAVADFRASVLANWNDLRASLLAFLQKLQDLGLIDKTEKLTSGLFERLDGDLLFPDLYRTPERLAEYGISSLSKDDAGKVIRLLGELVKQSAKRGIAPPIPYYAVLVLDGDHMGQLLDDIQPTSGRTPRQVHESISQALATIAKRTTQEAQRDFHATVVYSGGDDALLLLPASEVMAAADCVRKVFTEELASTGQGSRHASAGAAIVHHQSPLQRSLEAARKAEASAKEDYDRNALAVSLLRRSGEPRQASLHWNDDFLQALEELRTLVAKGDLSGKLAYEFQDEAYFLPDPAVELELQRLARRHSEGRLLTSSAYSLASALCDGGRQALKSLPGNAFAGQIAAWLVIMRFLAKGDAEWAH